MGDSLRREKIKKLNLDIETRRVSEMMLLLFEKLMTAEVEIASRMFETSMWYCLYINRYIDGRVF